MTKKLTSRVLASRPMIQINGKVYYLSSGTSMVHTAGQVVGLFTNTWMGVSGIGRLELTDQGKFRRINKRGNDKVIIDVDSERKDFDAKVIEMIQKTLPEFNNEDLNTFYQELMDMTGENESFIRRGVSSTFGKIAPDDLLLSAALSSESLFFTQTSLGAKIRERGIAHYGQIEINEELDADQKPVEVNYPPEADLDFENLTENHLPNHVLAPRPDSGVDKTAELYERIMKDWNSREERYQSLNLGSLDYALMNCEQASQMKVPSTPRTTLVDSYSGLTPDFRAYISETTQLLRHHLVNDQGLCLSTQDYWNQLSQAQQNELHDNFSAHQRIQQHRRQ